MRQNTFNQRDPQRHLTIKEALDRLSRRLAWYGPETLRVGRICAVNETFLTVEIMSQSGQIVREMEVDRSTGDLAHGTMIRH